MFPHLLFKLVLVFGGKTFLLSVSVDLSFIYLSDVYHTLTIVDSECLGGSLKLVVEEEGIVKKIILKVSILR